MPILIQIYRFKLKLCPIPTTWKVTVQNYHYFSVLFIAVDYKAITKYTNRMEALKKKTKNHVLPQPGKAVQAVKLSRQSSCQSGQAIIAVKLSQQSSYHSSRAVQAFNTQAVKTFSRIYNTHLYLFQLKGSLIPFNITCIFGPLHNILQLYLFQHSNLITNRNNSCIHKMYVLDVGVGTRGYANKKLDVLDKPHQI